MEDMIGFVIPTFENGEWIHRQLSFGVGSLRKVLDLLHYKGYSEDPTREELISFLDSIHCEC